MMILQPKGRRRRVQVEHPHPVEAKRHDMPRGRWILQDSFPTAGEARRYCERMNAKFPSWQYRPIPLRAQ